MTVQCGRSAGPAKGVQNAMVQERGVSSLETWRDAATAGVSSDAPRDSLHASLIKVTEPAEFVYQIVSTECDMTQRGRDRGSWPDPPYPAWRETFATLRLWTQIEGKIRLSQTPWLYHSWQVPLYVTARGLTTSPLPYGERAFPIDLDFIQCGSPRN